MVRRKTDYSVQQKENMRDGDGVVIIENLLTPAELYENGRLFAKMTLHPGASIGYHVHDGEMESFYIMSGVAEYSDNGDTVTLLPGDTALNPSGDGHSIKSIGDTPLELIAMILFKR